MRAAILSIGDELITGASVDTNAPWLADQLASRAVTVCERRTIGDDRLHIAASIRDLAAEADIILMTGGLGPTDDDLTRDALGDAVNPGQDLVVDERAFEQLKRRFARAGRVMPANNQRQAMRPVDSECLKNRHGTAPGLRATIGGAGRACVVFALPGPPHEMTAMFAAYVLPELAASASSNVAITCLVRAYGLSESEAAERLGDILARGRNPLVGITVSEALITARIRGVGVRDEMMRAVDDVAAQIESKWGAHAFGRDDDTLALSAGNLLRECGGSICTAESCTGGWLGKLIVDPAGSSDYFRGGWVTYSNEMKESQLGVPGDLLEAHGAVSRQVAAAMSEGAASRTGSRFALAITGIAGPDGGSDSKPVGTVFIALAESNEPTEVRRFRFPGDRMMVRDRSAKSALQMLRFRLLRVSVTNRLLWQVDEPDDV